VRTPRRLRRADAGRAERELERREDAYAATRDVRVLVFSWNVDAAKPGELPGDEAGVFGAAVAAAGAPDVVAFGLQEVVDLESRRMLAKSLALGGRKSDLGEHVTGAYRRWHDRLCEVMRAAGPYTLVAHEHLVGLFSALFVKSAELPNVGDAQTKAIKCGMGGRYGNKVRDTFVLECAR
jgi:hypothetical protein